MIEVLRVDDRLLHGQVAVSWVNYYKADVILIANDELIENKVMQTAFKLACPPNVTLSMKSVEGASRVINNPKHAPRKIMVITRNMNDAKTLIEKTGDAIKDVLLGGLRSGEGKKQIDNNSYMSQEDIEIMDCLTSRGLNVFMQAVPTLKKLTAVEIKQNYNK